jgi:hypothetical protein
VRTAQCALRRSSEPARCLGRLLDTTINCSYIAVDIKTAKERELSDSLVDEYDDSNWPDGVSAGTSEPVLALRPVLSGFRAVLAQGWTPDTAYPGSVTESHWFPGNPQGQCGVSSVWLAEELAREYSIPSTFCLGSLIFDDEQAVSLPDHWWLEIAADRGDELVLDLTCDQAQGFDRAIVFDSKTELGRARIYYISRDRVNVSDLPNNPVWPRYQKLLRNIAA